MKEAKTSTRYDKKDFSESHHVCLIYENEEQRLKIISEFLATGLKQGELVRYFADTTPPEKVRSLLTDMGIDLTEAEEKGGFAITTAEKAYCPSGVFEPKEVIENMKKRYKIAKESGYSGSRVSGEMTWALKDIPGSDRFLEYEVLINSISDSFPHDGMCQYDARLFDGVTLFKILQVHPYIIAQGQVVRNPYYIKTEDYLESLQKP
jgi:hypothetical protein